MTLDEATSIWSEMTDVQREAVATLALKIAPPWCGIAATRRGIEAYSRGKFAHVLWSNDGGWWWTTEWAFGRVESLEEAMAKADERLVTAGYLVA